MKDQDLPPGQHYIIYLRIDAYNGGIRERL